MALFQTRDFTNQRRIQGWGGGGGGGGVGWGGEGGASEGAVDEMILE